MTYFSQLLSQHIHQKNIKVYALAQYLDLDRSNMYKIINGKRMPSSSGLVHKICKFLSLSYDEEQALKCAYEIDLQGADNYFRRKNLFHFFANFRLPQVHFSSLDLYEKNDFTPPRA